MVAEAVMAGIIQFLECITIYRAPVTATFVLCRAEHQPKKGFNTWKHQQRNKAANVHPPVLPPLLVSSQDDHQKRTNVLISHGLPGRYQFRAFPG
jgi:hypothetical protein